MKLIVSRAAWTDVERLRAFLIDRNPRAGQQAVAALVNAVQSLEGAPERGRPSGQAGVRELIVPFGRSAYILRYAYSAPRDEVVVLRIWHGREVRE